jgi:hypothetical protein
VTGVEDSAAIGGSSLAPSGITAASLAAPSSVVAVSVMVPSDLLGGTAGVEDSAAIGGSAVAPSGITAASAALLSPVLRATAAAVASRVPGAATGEENSAAPIASASPGVSAEVAASAHGRPSAWGPTLWFDATRALLSHAFRGSGAAPSAALRRTPVGAETENYTASDFYIDSIPLFRTLADATAPLPRTALRPTVQFRPTAPFSGTFFYDTAALARPPPSTRAEATLLPSASATAGPTATELAGGQTWVAVDSETISMVASFSEITTVVDSITAFVTAIGVTLTFTRYGETFIELQTVTIGLSRFAMVTHVTVFIPMYSIVRSHVLSQLMIITSPPGQTGMEPVMLIGIVSGGALLLAIIVGLVVFVLRSRKDYSGSDTWENAQSLDSTAQLETKSVRKTLSDHGNDSDSLGGAEDAVHSAELSLLGDGDLPQEDIGELIWI